MAPAAKGPGSATNDVQARPKAPAKSRQKPRRVTPAQRASYMKQLRVGRKLAKQKLWAAAARAFSQATKVVPMEGMAQGELCWAAFKSGDLRAARIAGERAALVARKPRVKAAVLYNLGRIAEAESDKRSAAIRYAQSLALRPNAVVAARLKKLGLPSLKQGRSIEPSTVQCKAKTDKGVCACLREKALKEYSDPDGVEITCKQTHKAGDRVRLALKHEDQGSGDSSTRLYLAAKQGAEWTILGCLGEGFQSTGVINTSSDSVEVTTLEQKTLGTRQVLQIEVQVTSTAEGVREGYEETATKRHQTICVVPAKAEDEVTCPLQLLVYSDEDDDPSDGVRKDVTPIDLEVLLSDQGTASVKLAPGSKRSDGVTDLLGTYKLW